MALSDPAEETSFGRVVESLRRMGLVEPDEAPELRALSGGVSSLIVRAGTRRGPVCFKMALAKLRVEQDWFAPLERNAAEVAWIREVAHYAPDNVPALLGVDPPSHSFAMRYFDESLFRSWKSRILQGTVVPATARCVGYLLGTIHKSSAARDDLAAAFANVEQFRALRLDPYFHAVGLVHPDRADRLREIAEGVAGSRIALMHGDVSPKNVLVDAAGDRVVLVDAECACYGDPAFDAAFCLTHLALKMVRWPEARPALETSFLGFLASYLGQADWEPVASLDGRAAALLPALLLARIDGKSPVEYIDSPNMKDRVRSASRGLLADPEISTARFLERWSRETLA